VEEIDREDLGLSSTWTKTELEKRAQPHKVMTSAGERGSSYFMEPSEYDGKAGPREGLAGLRFAPMYPRRPEGEVRRRIGKEEQTNLKVSKDLRTRVSTEKE